VQKLAWRERTYPAPVHDGLKGGAMAQVNPWYWGFGWYWWFLAVLLLIILGIVLARLITFRSEERARNAALEALRRRFEDGEISAEEYRARRAMIESRDPRL